MAPEVVDQPVCLFALPGSISGQDGVGAACIIIWVSLTRDSRGREPLTQLASLGHELHGVGHLAPLRVSCHLMPCSWVDLRSYPWLFYNLSKISRGSLDQEAIRSTGAVQSVTVKLFSQPCNSPPWPLFCPPPHPACLPPPHTHYST